MEGEKGPVCVTGGTGFIGSWLIMRLLNHGYSVIATVRSKPEHKQDLNFLTSLPGASEKLKIFNADLNDPESFDAAIKGCVGVFHVATPLDFQEPEETMTKRSIDGAIGILKKCLESKTVKRVIYTSSATTVGHNGKDLDVMDESFWSEVDHIKALATRGRSYIISKTLTERKVLEFSEQHGLEVVTLIPSIVLGPFICPKFVDSVEFILELLSAKNIVNKSSLRRLLDLVHVDDVARAHIFLLEHPGAKGRYNCSSTALKLESASKLLSAKYPELQVPRKHSDEVLKAFNLLPTLSSKKLIDSGFQFKYGVEEMFDDAVKCCKEKGYL